MKRIEDKERFRMLASLVTSCVVGMSAATLVGCDRNDTPGEAIDEAIDEAGDALEEAGEEIQDAADDVADGIDDAADEVDDTIEDDAPDA